MQMRRSRSTPRPLDGPIQRGHEIGRSEYRQRSPKPSEIKWVPLDLKHAEVDPSNSGQDLLLEATGAVHDVDRRARRPIPDRQRPGSPRDVVRACRHDRRPSRLRGSRAWYTRAPTTAGVRRRLPRAGRSLGGLARPEDGLPRCGLRRARAARVEARADTDKRDAVRLDDAAERRGSGCQIKNIHPNGEEALLQREFKIRKVRKGRGSGASNGEIDVRVGPLLPTGARTEYPSTTSRKVLLHELENQVNPCRGKRTHARDSRSPSRWRKNRTSSAKSGIWANTSLAFSGS